MRKIPLGMLVYLGGSTRFLFNVKAGFKIHGRKHIVKNIDSVLSILRDLEFKVSLAATRELQVLRNELMRCPEDAVISPEDSGRLQDIMGNLEFTLKAEASTMDAYVLSERRFEAVRLVDEPESLFAPETFGKLPRIAQLDIQEAGKCIGFGLPTAGAFHLLRATEDSLRSYYRTFVKRGNIQKSTRGKLVVELRAKKRKPKPSETLLNHLDHIRENFRNPTDHPDMVYDMDGVQDLLALVIDVLNRVAKELPEAALDWLDEPGSAANVMHGLAPDLSGSSRPVTPGHVTPIQVAEDPSFADSDADEQTSQEGPSRE